MYDDGVVFGQFYDVMVTTEGSLITCLEQLVVYSSCRLNLANILSRLLIYDDVVAARKFREVLVSSSQILDLLQSDGSL